MILRIPGVGVQSAKMIVDARRFRRLNSYHLKKIGVVMKRAKYFITCNELPSKAYTWEPERLKTQIVSESISKYKKAGDTQLELFPLVLQPKKEEQKAIMVIARKLVKIIYKVIKGTMTYKEYGRGYFLLNLQEKLEQKRNHNIIVKSL